MERTNNEQKVVATITSVGYDMVNGISVTLAGRDYVRFISPSNLRRGGRNCEISQLVVGGKIQYDEDNVHPAVRDLGIVTIISDGIREIDPETGDLIKW